MIDPGVTLVAFLAGALTGVSISWGYHRLTAETPQRPAQARVRCLPCERVFPTREDAREHAREVHNAPGDARAVDRVLEAVE